MFRLGGSGPLWRRAGQHGGTYKYTRIDEHDGDFGKVPAGHRRKRRWKQSLYLGGKTRVLLIMVLLLAAAATLLLSR